MVLLPRAALDGTGLLRQVSLLLYSCIIVSLAFTQPKARWDVGPLNWTQ